MKKVLASALPILCVACQTYSAVAVNGINTGNDVSLLLTDAGTTRMASSVGPRVTRIDGTVKQQDSAGIRLAVREVVHSDGVSDFLHGELITVPLDAVSTAQLKRISPARSVILAGAIVVGLAAIAKSAGGDGVSPNSGSGSSGTPQ